MYGIINKAIEELVTHQFGEDKWQLVKEKGNITEDYFISTEAYDDQITYALAGSIAEVMEIPLSAVLIAFGEWWILKTGKERYGSLMASGGSTLRDFLINLPDFHTRVMLMYPKLTPPEFKITDVSDDSLHVHYYSEREGLLEFVRGLLQGLSKLYNTETKIEVVTSREEGHDHDVFKVSGL